MGVHECDHTWLLYSRVFGVGVVHQLEEPVHNMENINPQVLHAGCRLERAGGACAGVFVVVVGGGGGVVKAELLGCVVA
jgi:hypothetical protein